VIQYLENFGYGKNQWAFRKRSSSRDLSLVCVSSWILCCCRGFKVALYFGDIKAAFDRVYKDYLLAKLHSIGVADTFIDFLNSYLEPRIGRVAVEGVLSDVFELADMVFQGTVLGPSLWNVFFHDVANEASCLGGKEQLFADDLTVSKAYATNITNEEIAADMTFTKKSVHAWGTRNRVEFDADKEHVLIMYLRHGERLFVKLFGCTIDAKLTMSLAVDQLVARVRPKVKALPRTRGMYSHADMMMQYKKLISGA